MSYAKISFTPLANLLSFVLTFGDPSDRSTSTVWMHTIRRDHTTHTCFPAAPMSSGMTAVMLEKPPEQ